MAKDAGRDMLLQKEDSPGAGTYTTVGAIRAKSLTINNEEIDTSSGDSQWKERLAGGERALNHLLDDGGAHAAIES